MNSSNEFYILFFLLLILLIFLCLVVYVQSRRLKELFLENEELKISNSDCRSNLLMKSLLLKEIHHRIKNNLQLIIDLVAFNIGNNQFSDLDSILRKVQSRILAIAKIHDKFCENDSFSDLDMQHYLEELIDNSIESYNVHHINFMVNCNQINLDFDTAIPLGLIINELLCNSIKYAFDGSDNACFNIEIRKAMDEVYELEIGDNGVGFDVESISKSSVGLELVDLLVKQLRGSIQLLDTKGTRYLIIFKKSNFYEKNFNC